MRQFEIIFISIIFGYIAKLLFIIIRNKNIERDYFLMDENMFNYYSVLEIAQLSNIKKYLKYLLFRVVPIFLALFLLQILIEKYFIDIYKSNYYIFITAIIFIIYTDVFKLKEGVISFKQKTLHAINIVLSIIITFIVLLIGIKFNLSSFSPTIQGLVDNLWSSVIVVVSLVFYFKSSEFINLENKNEIYYTNKNFELEKDLILNEANKIAGYYDFYIKKYSDIHKSPFNVVKSIVIYESINRPTSFRSLENLFVKIFKIEMTLGIAQVKSNKFINDEESIEICCKQIGDLFIDYKGIPDSIFVTKIIHKYNGSKKYKDNILKILQVLEN